jgi:riboflavin biosynthesis pyrimidine reductase
VYPPGAQHFAELRRHLGRSPDPPLIVLTASGILDPTHPGLRPGSVVLTGDAGAQRARGRVPDGVVVRSLGDLSQLPIERVMDAVHERDHEIVLTEGGPHLIGQLLEANLLDELFLTLSPVLLGRSDGDMRQGLADGVGFAGGTAPQLEIESVRRHGSYLFLRYGVRGRSER